MLKELLSLSKRHCCRFSHVTDTGIMFEIPALHTFMFWGCDGIIKVYSLGDARWMLFQNNIWDFMKDFKVSALKQYIKNVYEEISYKTLDTDIQDLTVADGEDLLRAYKARASWGWNMADSVAEIGNPGVREILDVFANMEEAMDKLYEKYRYREASEIGEKENKFALFHAKLTANQLKKGTYSSIPPFIW